MTRPVIVDAAGVDYCDGAGIALLVDLLRQPRAGAGRGRQPEARVSRRCSRQFDPHKLEHDLDPEPPRRPAIEEIGRTTAGVLRDLRTQVEFLGQATAALGERDPPSVDRPLARRVAWCASASARMRCRSSR